MFRITYVRRPRVPALPPAELSASAHARTLPPQVGLAVLVLIEIFINSPAFQTVKPIILRFTEGE